MKKALVFLILGILFLPHVVAAKEKVTVYVFTKGNESISVSALDFFKNLKQDEIGEYFDYQEIEVWDEDWHQDEQNRKLVDKVASYHDYEILGAPYIIIGQKYSLATFTEDYTEEIVQAIKDAYADDKYEDLVQKAKKELAKKQKQATIISISISLTTMIVITLFIIKARKNND